MKYFQMFATSVLIVFSVVARTDMAMAASDQDKAVNDAAVTLTAAIKAGGWARDEVSDAVTTLVGEMRENSLLLPTEQGAVDQAAKQLTKLLEVSQFPSEPTALETLRALLTRLTAEFGTAEYMSAIDEISMRLASLVENATQDSPTNLVTRIRSDDDAQAALGTLVRNVDLLVRPRSKSEQLGEISETLKTVYDAIKNDTVELQNIRERSSEAQAALKLIAESTWSLQADAEVIISGEAALEALKLRLGGERGNAEPLANDLVRLKALRDASSTQRDDMGKHLVWFRRPAVDADSALDYFVETLTTMTQQLKHLERDMAPDVRAYLREMLNNPPEDNDKLKKPSKSLSEFREALSKLRDEYGVHIVRAWYGNLYAGWSSGEQCDATLAMRARCQRESSCRAHDTSTSVVDPVELCGYNAAPVATGNARGVAVQYACLRGGAEMWHALLQSPRRNPLNNNHPFQLGTDMSQAVLRSGRETIHCVYPAPNTP